MIPIPPLYYGVLGNAGIARPRMSTSGNTAASPGQGGIQPKISPNRDSGVVAQDSRGSGGELSAQAN